MHRYLLLQICLIRIAYFLLLNTKQESHNHRPIRSLLLIFLCNLLEEKYVDRCPILSDSGTFILNGHERIEVKWSLGKAQQWTYCGKKDDDDEVSDENKT